MEAKDLNTVLSCIYQLYGTNVPYLFLDEIQDVDGWHLFVNRLLRSKMRIFVTGSNAKLLSSELATHLTGRRRFSGQMHRNHARIVDIPGVIKQLFYQLTAALTDCHCP